MLPLTSLDVEKGSNTLSMTCTMFDCTQHKHACTHHNMRITSCSVREHDAITPPAGNLSITKQALSTHPEWNVCCDDRCLHVAAWHSDVHALLAAHIHMHTDMTRQQSGREALPTARCGAWQSI